MDRVLRAPHVLPFLSGRIASVFGRQVFAVAVGWDVYERTGSVFALGLVGLVQVLPVVVLAIFSGHVVDRLGGPRVAVASQLTMLAAASGLAVVATGAFSAPLVYGLLALHATAVSLNSPAVASMLPRLVPPEDRPKLNTYSSSGFEAASIAGPAMAGLLLATGTARFAYILHAVCAAAFAVVLVSLGRKGVGESPERAAKVKSVSDLLVGVRFIFGSKLLLPALSLDLFAVLLGGVTALLPVFAKEILHVGPTGLGLLRAAPAAGALLMAMALTRLAPWRRPGVVLLVAVAVFGVVTLGFGLSTNPWLSGAFLAVAGAADMVSVVIRMTLEQQLVPDALRGRVSAIHYVFIGLSNELGEFESGMTAALLGPVGSVVLGGIGTLAVVAVIARFSPAMLRLGPLADIVPEDAPSQLSKERA